MIARLKRSDGADPGIRRQRRGKGFEYFDPDGNKVDDPELLERINELVIPPAWKDVWICPYPLGHIQAIGFDGKGRKQYRYHQQWRESRDREKFDEMLDFARSLPGMRRQVSEHLSVSGLKQERVLGCAVRLLDAGFFRVGGENYAEENESYGLATVQKAHVKVGPEAITFDYPAKSGKQRNLVLPTNFDPEVHEIVGALKRRRTGGSELLAFKRGAAWVDIRSDDINAYIKEVTGGDFSAKDFRTWNATVHAAKALAVSGLMADTDSGRKKAIVRAVKEVSRYMANTPAVARASYIDPRVFERYAAGLTIAGVLEEVGAEGVPEEDSRRAEEEAVLDLVQGQDESESEAIERAEDLELVSTLEPA